MSKELEDYIRTHLGKGYSEHDIKEWLLKNNYTISEINDALKKVSTEGVNVEKTNAVFLVAVILVTAILVIGIFFMISKIFSKAATIKIIAKKTSVEKIPAKVADASLCDEIMDTIGKSDCVGTEAGKLKDINLCNNALNKDACYNAYALATKDPGICAKITDSNRRSSCQFFANKR